MADEALKNTIKQQLTTAWLRATGNITGTVEEHLARFKDQGSIGGETVNRLEANALIGLAKRAEAEQRAEAITETLVDRLLEKIKTLEGRIEEMEVRIAALGAAGPTSTPTEL